MNWLVYQSLAPYKLSPVVAAARAELALQVCVGGEAIHGSSAGICCTLCCQSHDPPVQSRAAFLQNWLGDHRVMENHNSEDGAGCDVTHSMPWYHWGALDAWVALDAAGVLAL